jgi:uncharacterized membrane protein
MNQTQNNLNRRSTITPRALAASGLVIAAYIVVMYLMQGVSFGQYQMRLATSLYALAAVHPFLILPLGLSNLLSNALFGGLGPLDILGGFAAGILTSAACWRLRKINIWLVGLPVLVIPTLLVPIWLSYLLRVPYAALAVSVGIGQTAPAVLAVFLVRYLEKPLLKLQEGKK